MPARDKQPAGQQRFGERHGERAAPGGAEHGKAVGKACAGAAEIVRHPGERQPGLLERAPERRLPGLVFRPVDGLRIGEVGKNPRRRFGDDMLALASATLLPSRVAARTCSLRGMVGPSVANGKTAARP